MKRKIFMILITLSFTFIPLVVSAEENIITSSHDMLTNKNPYTVSLYGDPNNFIWTSSDTSVATVKDGVITPISDGACIIFVKNKDNVEIENKMEITVNAFGTVSKELDDYLNSTIPNKIKVDFSKDIKHLDESEDFDYYMDQLHSYFYRSYPSKNNLGIGVSCPDIYNCTISANRTYYDDDMYYIGQITSNQSKNVTVEYPIENENDKKESINAAKNIKNKYFVYINEILNDKSSVGFDVLYKKASIHKELKGFDLKFDDRSGDITPGKAKIGGIVNVGKNGVYYAGRNTQFYQILKTPELKGNILVAIKEFIEKYLLNDNQEATVEETDQIENNKKIYKITISEKEDNNLISMLLSPFVIKVKADNSYTLYTAIEEDPNMDLTTNKNSNTNIVPPKTGDVGLLYISLLAISSVGVVILSKKARLN